MLQMDGGDFGGGGGGGSSGRTAPITAKIIRAEEQTSIVMQRFTAYIVEVSDFGRTLQVAHRYSEFETLHRTLAPEVPGLPPMPPKGVDSTDQGVVARRKVELQKILTFMLQSEQAMMEKSLALFKFLELPNPAVIASRFIVVPSSRASSYKTLTKLVQPKYKDDMYRLGHPSMADLLMDAVRGLRTGEAGAGHWCRLDGGRAAALQLLGAALQQSDAARQRLLEADLMGNLLGLLERDENSLQDVRTALNIVVAREADKFAHWLAAFLRRGGLTQLAVLGRRNECQEFVAKLLWLSWDDSVRAPFVQPGGQGLQLLQVLLRSPVKTCSLLGAFLLAGLVANGHFASDPAHRAEAVRLVKSSLSQPDSAADPQFAKTLCGTSTTLSRLATLLDDADTAPAVLQLLCHAKPPPAKISQLAGNLAGMVGGASYSAETRARAAELLLHIQGGNDSGAVSKDPLRSSGGGAAPIPKAVDLTSCEGIAAHEESLEKAMKWQLDEALGRTREGLVASSAGVREVAAVSATRLQRPPLLDFRSLEAALTSFTSSREALDRLTSDAENLQYDMERQLIELQGGKPSMGNEQIYRERLSAVERTYAEVKERREALAAALAEATLAQDKAEAAGGDLKRASDVLTRLDNEIESLRRTKGEKDTEAMRIRHRANMPNLAQMQEQATQSLERNAQLIREVQVQGQRVQQGDPDYLRDGESRDQKISELQAKLIQLRKQQQTLQQQQKELQFDPVELGRQAMEHETAAAEAQRRIDSAQSERMEAHRNCEGARLASQREGQAARMAQERKQQMESQVSISEASARAQLESLQPMIQERHAGWQRLLGQQRKLDSDQAALSAKLTDARSHADQEAAERARLSVRVNELQISLHAFAQFLEQVGGEPPPPAPLNSPGLDGFAVSAAPAAAPARGVFAPDPFAPEPGDLDISAPITLDRDPLGVKAAAPAPAAAFAPPARDLGSLGLAEPAAAPTAPPSLASRGNLMAPAGQGNLFAADDEDDMFSLPTAPRAPTSAAAPPTALAEHDEFAHTAAAPQYDEFAHATGAEQELAHAPAAAPPPASAGGGAPQDDEFNEFLLETPAAGHAGTSEHAAGAVPATSATSAEVPQASPQAPAAEFDEFDL